MPKSGRTEVRKKRRMRATAIEQEEANSVGHALFRFKQKVRFIGVSAGDPVATLPFAARRAGSETRIRGHSSKREKCWKMKSLVYLTLVGLVLFEVCSAQSCNDQIDSLIDSHNQTYQGCQSTIS